MTANAVYTVHFSPSGTTQRMVGWVAQAFSPPSTDIDLLANPPARREFTPRDVVIVGMPVFSGRIPSLCPSLLGRLEGCGTPAILVAAYGNRAYEDALLEMYDILTAQHFCVFGAGAFPARHSLFPAVAADRPDERDRRALGLFALQCLIKLQRGFPPEKLGERIRGNRPYRVPSHIAHDPTAGDKCTSCGKCAEICPAGAINPMLTAEPDTDKCIRCMACAYTCPANARMPHGLAYDLAQIQFRARHSARKEPETFL